jgi:hypothetical protein
MGCGKSDKWQLDVRGKQEELATLDIIVAHQEANTSTGFIEEP